MSTSTASEQPPTSSGTGDGETLFLSAEAIYALNGHDFSRTIMNLERSIRTSESLEAKTKLGDLFALSLREKEDFGDSTGLEKFNKYFKHEVTKLAQEALQNGNEHPHRDTARDRRLIHRVIEDFY